MARMLIFLEWMSEWKNDLKWVWMGMFFRENDQAWKELKEQGLKWVVDLLTISAGKPFQILIAYKKKGWLVFPNSKHGPSIHCSSGNYTWRLFIACSNCLSFFYKNFLELLVFNFVCIFSFICFKLTCGMPELLWCVFLLVVKQCCGPWCILMLYKFVHFKK